MTILKRVPLEALLKTTEFVLKAVRTKNAFKNGVRSEEVEGITYTVVDTRSFESLSITVLGQTVPIISQDELQAANERGEHIYVKPVGAVVTPYYSEKSQSVEDSIRASSMEHVSKPSKNN